MPKPTTRHADDTAGRSECHGKQCKWKGRNTALIHEIDPTVPVRIHPLTRKEIFTLRPTCPRCGWHEIVSTHP